MKKKKKVYCIDGPCQGAIFKINPRKREFFIVTSGHLLYKRVHYTVTRQIGFVDELIAIYTGHIRRKRK